MSRFGKGTFGSGLEINAQVVNGKCPYCTTNGVFVSIHKSIFRCITCGGDIEQKINGKISYIPLGGEIVMKDTKDLTDG
jgi:ribosomal protein S27AE|tara:strand:+ start:178 stop:414 length:237 start_codon:yes stop_codon:yes gene_type:complete